jgi:hypothetical protein
MKRPNRILSSVIAAGVLGIATQSVLAQTTIFSDAFNNGSTVQGSPITPTSHSTTYQWFQQGGTPNTPVIAGAGDLQLAGRTTASSIAEFQALFTPTPITLTTIGDTLTFNISFVDSQNIFPAGSASTINIGMYNSGGTAPQTGSRLDSTTYTAGGGSQLWNGYVARIGGTGGASSSFYTRYLQGLNGTTSQNQDLLFNGASGSAAYNSPTGSTIATSGGAFAAGLTAGSSYTLSYSITLTGANTLSFNNTLFDSGNNAIFTQSGSLTSATNNYTFDAMAFGWRYNSTAATNAIDVSSISVIQSVTAVPEPTTVVMTLTGFGLLFLVCRSRR